MTDSQCNASSRPAASRLLRAARGSSTRAREQLLNLYWQFLVDLAAANIGRELQAKVAPSDIAQETLLRAHRNFEQFKEGSVVEWEGWLRTLALNTLADLRRRFYRKKRNVKGERSLQDVNSHLYLKSLSTMRQPTPHQRAADREQVQRILAAADKLRKSHRAIILWRYRDSLDLGQIAAKLDRSVDATRMLLARAVEALNNKLRDSDDI